MVNRLSPYNQFKQIAQAAEWSGLEKDTPPLDLELPHGAKLCATGLVLPDELELDQWETVGRALMAMGSSVLWALSEWWAFGEHAYGKRASIAKKLPYDFGTLMNYGMVARKVPTSSRNEALSFAHHMAVAKLEPGDQKKWLAKAFRGSALMGTPAKPWSVNKLRQAIHDAQETHRAMDDREFEKKDPVGYRKAQSLKSASDAIDEFENIIKGNWFLSCSVQAITTDQSFIADLPDHTIARLIEVASSILDRGIIPLVGKTGITESDFPRNINSVTQTATYLDHLNPEQRRAVEHGTGGPGPFAPLLVIAGAGSGKTNTLAHRVAHLIVNGADPHRILLMTFSRRAASEMTKRVERIARKVLGNNAGIMTDALTWSGTFHGIGARLLRDYSDQIGLSPQFTIHDREDSADLINLIRHERGFSKTESRFPTKGTCLSIYSRCVNAETAIEQVLGASFPWCSGWAAELKELFEAYVEAKQKQNVLDYDDLLLYWAQTMGDSALADDIGSRFDHVLVDEYQDTNRLQSSILLALKPGGRGLTVVGDDAQSIYSFRAATVRNILDFPTQFSPPARTITLDRNYRSTQTILAAANGVIGLAKERFTKNLWTDRTSGAKPQLVTVRDEADQARCIVERILENRESGTLLKQQAVLFRTSSHSGPLEVELTRRNIPFVKFGGLKFLDAAHIKDMLALLRFVENPRDRVAGFRLLHLLPGVGPASAQRVLDYMAEAADPIAALCSLPAPPRTGDDWKTFVQAVGDLRYSEWPSDLERARHWYEPHLDRIHEDAETRRADLVQLEQIASGYPSRERFLTELTLDPPDATSDQAGVPLLDEDYLILSTIHSAKGQEWKSVFLLNVVDGCLPSDLGTGTSAEIEEERRLLYVAMTRAKDDLHLVVPQRFFTHGQHSQGDRHVYASRTRFIPDRLLDLFEKTTWPRVSASAAARSPSQVPRIDVGARMRGMWR